MIDNHEKSRRNFDEKASFEHLLMKRIILLVSLSSILFGCAAPAEQAKQQIEKSGYAFDAEGLSTAILAKNQKVKDLFIKSDYPSETILKVAVTEQDLELVTNLLQSEKVDVNADNGRILWRAVSNKQSEMVQLLLGKGANPNLQPCLAEAARLGSLEISKLLVNSGAKVNDTDTGSLALVQAVVNRKPELVEFLLSKGANPNSEAKVDNGYFSTTINLGKLGNRVLTTNEIKALLNEYRKKV